MSLRTIETLAEGAAKIAEEARLLDLLGLVGPSRFTKNLTELAGKGTQNSISLGEHAELGGVRTYDMYNPSGNSEQPKPLMLVLHGATFTKLPQNMVEETGMNIMADAHDFLVAYPQAFSRPIPAGLLKGVQGQSWNVPFARNGTVPTWNNYNDIDYLDAVIADASSRFNIDPNRIMMTGFSDGGRMSLRYPADRPGKIAAIASVHGTVFGDETKLAADQHHPAAMVIHSIRGNHFWQDDMMVPYKGGLGRASGNSIWSGLFDGLKDSQPSKSLEFMLKNPAAARDIKTANGIIHTSIDNGGVPLEEYLLVGAQHAWHGTLGKGGLPLIGGRNKDFDVTRTIVPFLLSHRLPDGSLPIERSLTKSA